MITNDVDVPVDWLYKGSKPHKKARRKNRSAVAVAGAAGKTERSRSLSISNASLSHGMYADPHAKRVSGTMAIPGAMAGAIAGAGAVAIEDDDEVDIRADGGPGARMPALTKTHSLNQETKDEVPVLTPPPTPTQSRNSPSLVSVKRSASTSSKPKKTSLFGSLFGRSRSSSQSNDTEKKLDTAKRLAISTASEKKTYPQELLTPASPVSANSPSPDIRRSTSITKPTKEHRARNSDNTTTDKNTHQETQKESGSRERPTDLTKISLKRVKFAVDKFETDPPQQLPSRTPKPGNIMIPDDMISELPAISVGITSNQQKNNLGPQFTKDSIEYKRALEIHQIALKEAEKHQQEAHHAARRIAHEVSNFSNGKQASAPGFMLNLVAQSDQSKRDQNSAVHDTDINIDLSEKLNKTGIDLPIHMHEHHFDDPGSTLEGNQEITLDVVYTRCCHLREILPIPSTLKQVTDKTAPLQTLKFLNPKPTLIDILSFCDFIAIVPIQTIVFDNVNLSTEMFKIVISSVAYSSVLEKISLRNVTMNKECWQLLCKFLLTSQSLNKIDISQTRIKPETGTELLRSSMDWDLFAKTLAKRAEHLRPLEEILVNGVNFDNIPLEDFQNFLITFATQKHLTNGIRLGLANATKSIYSVQHYKFLLEWMSNYNVQGVDLGFNDLSNLIKPTLGKLSSLTYPNLHYFTLNSTNIQSTNDMALLLKALSKLPNLEFLDLSNLPQVFPDILPYMYKYLPRFPQLKRLHIDNENMTYKEMTVVCNLLAKCTGLIHVSMLSQKPPMSETESAENLSTNGDSISGTVFAKNNFSATLYAFVRDSPNLVGLDIDYSSISDEVSSRLALCLMRNMRRTMDSSFQLDELDSQDELLFDGSLVTMTAKDVLERLTQLNTKQIIEKKDATKRYLLKKYVQKLHKIHNNVQQTIDNLFEKRKSGDLPMQEKENLVRLILLEKNLVHILDIFDNMPNLSEVLGENKIASSDSLVDHPNLRHVVETDNLNENSNERDLQVNENDNLQQRPHLMATESGRTIDTLTGRPVFSRRSSTTSLASKKQEEEEGDFHKWGFYIQQQKALYPDGESHYGESSAVSASTSQTTLPSIDSKEKKIFTKLPSGPELRTAIIKAKGVSSIEELIQKINDYHCCDIESLYNILKQNELEGNGIVTSESDLTDNEREHLEGAVKNIYEQLLNNASMNRDVKKVNQ